MANKRTLKRAIHLICDELFSEAVAVSMYGPEAGKGNAEAHICVKYHKSLRSVAAQDCYIYHTTNAKNCQ